MKTLVSDVPFVRTGRSGVTRLVGSLYFRIQSMWGNWGFMEDRFPSPRCKGGSSRQTSMSLTPNLI